jgi:hypothetical protein
LCFGVSGFWSFGVGGRELGEGSSEMGAGRWELEDGIYVEGLDVELGFVLGLRLGLGLGLGLGCTHVPITLFRLLIFRPLMFRPLTIARGPSKSEIGLYLLRSNSAIRNRCLTEIEIQSPPVHREDRQPFHG